MAYETTTIRNPFGAPVMHIAETESTMGDARQLAGAGYPTGTVVYADLQNAGRGRIAGRKWTSAPGTNLLCTVILRCPPLPGFTLRVGLAVALAFDAFLPPPLATRIKWPNDVLLGGKKLAGILCENDGSVLYVGTGLNIGQTVFPPELQAKATSLSLASASADPAARPGDRPVRPVPSPEEVLPVYLDRLQSALALDDWQTPVTEKLLWRGERISFLAGDPENHELLDGTVEGIGPSGELLFRPAVPTANRGHGPHENTRTPFVPDESGLLHLWSGEIRYPCER